LPATFYDFLPPLRPAQDSALAMHNHRYYGYLSMFGPRPPSEPLPTRAALLASTQAQFGQSRRRDLVLASYVYDQLSAHEARALVPLLADVQALTRGHSTKRVSTCPTRLAGKGKLISTPSSSRL
jgi:hypothetical protein